MHLSRTPKRNKHFTSAEDEGCNKDERKIRDETSVSRKTSGILVAVTPCLQIVAIRPMFAAESLCQVLLLVLHLLTLFADLSHVVYDNACSMMRHINRQRENRKKRQEDITSWNVLAVLQWIIDRLHWRYHRACKDPLSSYFVPGVSPKEHPELIGVDTEAAEQIFHVANRWQTILSNSAPMHQEIFMLLFAREHNRAHSCAKAISTYKLKQKEAKTAGNFTVDTETSEVMTGACSRPKKCEKRRKVIVSSCEELPADQASASSSVNSGMPAQAAPGHKDPQVSVDTDYVVVNWTSRTIHGVVLQRDVYTKCSWSFQNKSVAQSTGSVKEPGLWTCGVCFQARTLFSPSE
jgi:hypothetical protein